MKTNRPLTNIIPCFTTLIVCLGAALQLPAQNNLVPAADAGTLAAERQQISALRAKADALAAESKSLKQQSAQDAATTTAAVQKLTTTSQQEMQTYLGKIAEIEKLRTARRAQLEAELTATPLLAQQPAWEYNRRVFLRNAARDRCGQDLREADGALAVLKRQMQTQAATHLAQLKAVQNLHAEAQQTRKRVFEAKRFEYESQVAVVNLAVRAFNSNLITQGTPAAH